ncbi:MAG TPA: hypothetical protein VD840_16545, partial [Sinorhizobium sp.]|nr:hypothetical protein [Sinorhizobium sp.]
LALAKLNKEVLIDVADVSIDAEIERAILDKAGVRLKVTSTLLDAEHCLVFVHVAPGSLPANVDFARIMEIGDQIKQHVRDVVGKMVDQVYWQFPAEERLRLVAGRTGL